MASSGSTDRVHVSEPKGSYLKMASDYRKFKIEDLFGRVEKLKLDSETETVTVTEAVKRRSRISKLHRQVMELCKEASVKTQTFQPKTVDLWITKKTVRRYLLGIPVAKLEYDRDFTGYNDPSAAQGFKGYVQFAIKCFNTTHSTEYELVEVLRVFKGLPVSYIYSLYFIFTAKIGVDGVSAPKTFKAVIGFSMHQVLVLFVDIVDASAISPLAN